jgi:pimeloyl-ACP methyl ester carboxylesterase
MPAPPSTQPFRIGIAEAVLEDLRERLLRTRRARFQGRGGWDAGTDPDYLDELIEYWRLDYDWRRHERELNQLAHYRAHIDAAHVHYIHETAVAVRSTPVLLLHGWPDSFLRYRDVIPFLTGIRNDDESEPAFDVVIPSLPGFAFTGAVPPFEDVPTIDSSARLMHRLMTEVLGHQRYLVAGGDGGSAIAQSLALQFPQAIIGIHLTDIGWGDAGDEADLTEPERKYVAVAKQRFMGDGAYAMVHASQPRALAASLNDSPAGLASWIVDRFHSWCDSPRQLEESVSKDQLLTNITIYWVTQTIQSSIYGYLAETRRPTLKPNDWVGRPVGLALFPRDLAGIPPRRLAERRLNVVHWTEMPRGGHFGAWELPEEFAIDLKRFVATLDDPLIPGARHGYRPSKTV